MSAPTPSAIQDAIVNALATRYSTFTVEVHGGDLVEREMPLLLNKVPALLLACTGFPTVRVYQSAAHWQIALRFRLLVLSADTATVERADQAIDTTFDLLTWLPQQRWGLTEARLPDADSLTADNLYTGSLNNLRVAFWGLSWLQTFQTAFPVS